MNQIFILYSVQSTSVHDSMELKDVSAELLVEKQRFFVESLAIATMRHLLKYNTELKRFTIVKCYENTPKLRDLIVDTVVGCVLGSSFPLIKVAIETITLDKYLDRLNNPVWLNEPKIKVFIQPMKGELPVNEQESVQRLLSFLLGDQFEVQVLGAPMAITEGLIII